MRYICLSFFLLLSLCSAQPAGDRSPVIARAGSIFISEQEFLERYELLPGRYRNRRNNVEESKLVFLYSLVAEKLLAQEAFDRHVDQESGFQTAISGIRKMLVRDQLYNEEVRAKVSVSPAEILTASKNARRKLFLSFLFFDDSTEAAFVHAHQNNCRRFDTFVIDTSMRALRDTATLVWGEAEAPIEEAGFRLIKGECSPVVRASTGYYILHLDRETVNPTYIDLQPDVLTERIESKLRLRKEKARLDEFVGTALLTRTGFSLPGPFKTVAATMNSIWKDLPSGSEQMVTDSVLNILEERCRPIINDSMTVVGSSFWTVGEVLSLLRGKVFTVDRSRTTGIAVQLNSQILVLVQQELLAGEGLARKLDERWAVKSELDVWKQQILSKYEEMYLQQKVAVPDAEIFHALPTGTPLPRVQLRELHTADLPTMEQAISAISSGMPWSDAIRKYSSDAESAPGGGLTAEFTIDKRQPLGAAAWNMQVGERRGPLRAGNEYVYFEVVKKDLPAGISDSSFTSLMRRTAGTLRAQKEKNSLDSFIARSAQRRGYTIYYDRLKMLKVTNVPMMTYRILGFGGRMFAAPFVTPQVDWINVENPDASPLP